MTGNDIHASIRFTSFTASDKFEKYSANMQREMFGAAVFGRKDIRWNARRNVVETRVRTISMDWDVQSYTLDEVAALVSSGSKASKGYGEYGK